MGNYEYHTRGIFYAMVVIKKHHSNRFNSTIPYQNPIICAIIPLVRVNRYDYSKQKIQRFGIR